MAEKNTNQKKRKNARVFRGIWIPAEIWLDDKLTWMEKLMFAEIDSLSGDEGYFGSNAYLGRFFQLSRNRCSEIISALITKGYLRAEYDREGKNIKERRLYPVRKTDQGCSENRPGGSRKTDEGWSENRQGVVGKGERENPINERPTENPINPPERIDEKPLQFLIDLCDQINHIPRDPKVFQREMAAAKVVVTHTADFLDHYGGRDLNAALDWLVKIAERMKQSGHWYLKARSILPSTIKYSLDEIMTFIRDEKERQEKSAAARAEYENLKKPVEVKP